MTDFRTLSAVALGALALLSMWRSARGSGSWRSASVALQLPLAAVLWLLLCPPERALRSDVLTVLTPGVTAAQRSGLRQDRQLVALPGVAVSGDIEAVPDLATALRRHPLVRTLQVIGDGLPARDRDLPDSLALQFDPAPAHGLQRLHAPDEVMVGAQWRLSGRAAPPAHHAELYDPAGVLADETDIGSDGRFRLSALARGEGALRYRLRLSDAHRGIVDETSVPIVAHGGAALRLLIRAGSPDPDLKYFRRWATDAGLKLRFAAGLSPGVAVREGDTQLTPDALAATDLLVVDERAWAGLTEDEKAALHQAVEQGLGLLLRVTGPVADAVAEDWAGYGFRIHNGDAKRSVTLDQRLGTTTREPYTAVPVEVDAAQALPLLSADDGGVLAWRRSLGSGRVGLWTLADSFRLALAGDSGRYGSLWADTVAALARPQAPSTPRLPPSAGWVGQRTLVCGLGDGRELVDAGGHSIALSPDADHCAAWWPSAAGWYRYSDATGTFYIRAADDGGDLRRAADRQATEQLQRGSDQPPAYAARRAIARWPLLLLWLALASGVWWLERRAGAFEQG